MNKEVVFMFCGQGSQYPGMSREFYEELPFFREQMHYLDSVVVDRLGISVVDALYSSKGRSRKGLDEILWTHPGLFMIQYSIATCLMRDGIRPSYVLGCSLGESVSMAVSGVSSPEEVLDALIRQAILFKEKCSNGGMIAILDAPALFQENRDMFTGCELAGINCPKHFCIAGSDLALDMAEEYLRRVNVIYERLPVRQPFHSRHLDPIKRDFVNTFEGVTFSEGRFPAISSMSTKAVDNYCPEFMYDVVREPIVFYDTIRTMGIDADIACVDLGPSGTLSNFVKYSVGREHYRSIYSVMSPFGKDLPKYCQVREQLTEIMYSEGA